MQKSVYTFHSLTNQNGVLLRTVLDTVTGDLSDTRTRYLGSRPVKLFRVVIQKNDAVSFILRTSTNSFCSMILFVSYDIII